jgi:hypothetical protein
MKDWAKMAKAPLGLIGVIVLALFFAWLFVWQVVVPAKNEQINTKQGQIDLVQRELEMEKNSHIVSVTNLSVRTITNYTAVTETNYLNIITTNYLMAHVTNIVAVAVTNYIVAVTNYVTATNLNRSTSAVGNLPLRLQMLGCYSGVITKDQEQFYYFSLTASIGNLVFKFPMDFTPYHFNDSNYISVGANDFKEFVGPSKMLTVNWAVISQNNPQPYSQYTDTFSLEDLPITNVVRLAVDNIFQPSSPKLDMNIEYKIDKIK